MLKSLWEKSPCFVNALEMTELQPGSDLSGKSKFNWNINWAGVYLSGKKRTHSTDYVLRSDPFMENRLNLAEGRIKQAACSNMCQENSDL